MTGADEDGGCERERDDGTKLTVKAEEDDSEEGFNGSLFNSSS